MSTRRLSNRDAAAVRDDWAVICAAAARRGPDEVVDSAQGIAVRARVRAILSAPIEPPWDLMTLLDHPHLDGVSIGLVCAVLADLVTSGEVIHGPDGGLRLAQPAASSPGGPAPAQLEVRRRSATRRRDAEGESWEGVRGQLRSLAVEAAELGGGRMANRLSAYAMVLEARPNEAAAACAELEEAAQTAPDEALAEILREACRVIRRILPP